MTLLYFTSYTIIYLVSIALTVVILLAVLVKRQIQRFTRTPRRPYTPIGHGFSKSRRQCVQRQIEWIGHIRKNYHPKFNDVTNTSTAPHLHRMLALDEIAEIDRWLEYANCPLVRASNQSLYAFLKRLKEVELRELDENLIERLAYLYQAARFQPEPFEADQLKEVRQLLQQLRNLINREQGRLAAIRLQSWPADGVVDGARQPLLDRRRSAKNGQTNGSGDELRFLPVSAKHGSQV